MTLNDVILQAESGVKKSAFYRGRFWTRRVARRSDFDLVTRRAVEILDRSALPSGVSLAGYLENALRNDPDIHGIVPAWLLTLMLQFLIPLLIEWWKNRKQTGDNFDD